MMKFEIYNKEININKDKYNFIIEEVWYSSNKRNRKKFYMITKNNEDILHTTLHQTWYKYKRDIMKGVI